MKEKGTGKPIKGGLVKAVPKRKPDEVVPLALPEAYEARTDENGYYTFELPVGYYSFSISAESYETKSRDIEKQQDNFVLQVDAELARLGRGRLEGRVIVTNMMGVSMTGVKVKVLKNGNIIDETAVGSDGKYSTKPILEGDYTVSVGELEKHYLKPAEVSATVVAKGSEVVATIRDIPVEMISIPRAILALTKKKNWLGRGGGQVNQGHCKLGRTNPFHAQGVETLVAAERPDTSKDSDYGWFEFHDLLPGIYAVTFYKSGREKDLKKYSTYFMIGEKELRDYQDKPFPIGKNDGKDALQEMWTDMKEVRDQFDLIAGMAKQVVDILVPLGIKIQIQPKEQPQKEEKK